jgi:hypothetical protein
MILLLLGWNLTLLGLVTMLLAWMVGSPGVAGIGASFGVVGFAMSFALRKTCEDFRSDVAEPTDPNRTLDYY